MIRTLRLTMRPWSRLSSINSGICLLVALLVSPVLRAAPAQPDGDGDGIPDAIEDQLGLLPGVPQTFIPVMVGPNRGDGALDPDRDAPDILSCSLVHVGGQRVLFRTDFAANASLVGATFVIYLNMDNRNDTGRTGKDHEGVDIMVVASGQTVQLSFHSPDYADRSTIKAALASDTLWVVLEAPLSVRDGHAEVGIHLLSQRKGGRSDSTAHEVVRFPVFTDRKVPKLTMKTSSSFRSLSEYRYYNDTVKLERLADKGLRADQVTPGETITFGRPTPSVPFLPSRRPGVSSAGAVQRVTVSLVEEANVARVAADVRFGFPFPKGALFDAANIRLLDEVDAIVPCQCTPMAFWEDDSLKWVLIEAFGQMAPSADISWSVEFGKGIFRTPPAPAVSIRDTDTGMTVDTGALSVFLDKEHFNLFGNVLLRGKPNGGSPAVFSSAPAGVTLVDETGTEFTMSGCRPDSFAVERNGPLVAVVRVEGDYASTEEKRYMRYVARLTFRAGSPVVTLALTHVNNHIRTEFTDITRLTMPLTMLDQSATVEAFTVAGGEGKLDSHRLAGGSGVSFRQLDDERLALAPNGWERHVRASGVATVRGKQSSASLVVHEFWQRWPKGLALTDGGLAVEFLPEQPGPDYGKGLPHYLMYPFVEGKYRFKWGMSFTQRVTFDFSGSLAPETLHANAGMPIVPVLPATWYNATGAVEPLPVPRGDQFKLWDEYVAKSFGGFLERQGRYREYGYFNYGDWYGERGRNWGNNEYDLAHGLFMQFLRTGKREYFRWALTTARHQADVDCVHAYPDPAYIGANHQHSIGHTGTWTQTVQRATWSHSYDSHTDARNGHTWAEGMIDAWFLTGDARVMDAAIGLGEHITWAMSRNFTRLGTHERSAGWSLVAIMALYRATLDPLYLEAAHRIAAVPLREQKFDDGGAWPHILPRDHAGGHAGARGSNLFLIGVLLSGLAEYHAVTQAPEVRTSILSGARWMLKSWDERAGGWPYSATAEGEPLYAAKSGLNTLVSPAVAYAGLLAQDDAMMEVVATGLEATALGGRASMGKSLAQKLILSGRALGRLQAWCAQHRDDEGAAVMDGSTRTAFFLRTPDAEQFRIRSPNEKVFHVRLQKTRAVLTATRSPHGARPKDWPTGTLVVTDAAGSVVGRDEYSTDTKHTFECELRAPISGAVFTVTIRDDLRSVWGVSGEDVAVLADVSPGFSIGGVGRARFSFGVPVGTQSFKVKLVGVHGGSYGAVVIRPDGTIAKLHEGTNEGHVQLSWAPKDEGKGAVSAPERAELEVAVDPVHVGTTWGLVLWAAGDIACQLEGIPPYLARTPDDWFDPETK